MSLGIHFPHAPGLLHHSVLFHRIHVTSSPNTRVAVRQYGAYGTSSAVGNDRDAAVANVKQLVKDLEHLDMEYGDAVPPRAVNDDRHSVNAWKSDDKLDQWWKQVMQRKVRPCIQSLVECWLNFEWVPPQSERRALQAKKVKKDIKWIEKMKQKQKQRQKAKEKEEKQYAAEEARRRGAGFRGLHTTAQAAQGSGEVGGDTGPVAPKPLERAANDEPLKWQVSNTPSAKKELKTKQAGVWTRPGMFHTFEVIDS